MAGRADDGIAGGKVALTAPENYGRVTRNRLRAVVDEAVEMVTGRKRRHADGRDVYEVMADAILVDPLGAFAALDKLLPGGEKDGKGAALHIGSLYLQAVQQAQPSITTASYPAPLVIDPAAFEGGYIEGTVVDKPLITLNEW